MFFIRKAANLLRLFFVLRSDAYFPQIARIIADSKYNAL